MTLGILGPGKVVGYRLQSCFWKGCQWFCWEPVLQPSLHHRFRHRLQCLSVSQTPWCSCWLIQKYFGDCIRSTYFASSQCPLWLACSTPAKKDWSSESSRYCFEGSHASSKQHIVCLNTTKFMSCLYQSSTRLTHKETQYSSIPYNTCF